MVHNAPRRKRRYLSVAIVRPGINFRPQDWDTVPLRGTLHKRTPVPSAIMGLALVRSFNKLRLNQPDDRWAVLIDHRTTHLLGPLFLHGPPLRN